MTPKEKAIELYEKYEFVYIQNYTSKHEVKQCTLIAVDELIEDNKINEELVNGGLNKQYWEQVKTEIEKL
jgi:ABC-type Zn uptake system ZnuABC Zn-binding protein ZnuA